MTQMTAVDTDRVDAREFDQPRRAAIEPSHGLRTTNHTALIAAEHAVLLRIPALDKSIVDCKSKFNYRVSVVFFMTTILTIILVVGCSMNPQIIDEIDSAFAMRQKNEDVVAVVEKYITPGMSTENVFPFLQKLKGAGFSISEYRFEGARPWPDGHLRPYIDESTRKSMELKNPLGTIRFVAEMQYGRRYIILEKTAVITILIDESVVQRVDARVNVSGI